MLYSFTGAGDGGNPWAGLLRDSYGNLYGTTTVGGTAGFGTVFKIDAAGNETVLHSFLGGSDGIDPQSAVTMDAAGNLYGTTTGSGTGGGIVYVLNPQGQETILHTFSGIRDGSDPSSGATFDEAGNLYGTTLYGGIGDEGIVYKLDTHGIETILHTFSGSADGENPNGLIRDSAGYLLGTTFLEGGINTEGVVYEIDPLGNFTVVFMFKSGGGVAPVGPIVSDAAGNLYGTTSGGGSAQFGVVFQLKPAAVN